MLRTTRPLPVVWSASRRSRRSSSFLFSSRRAWKSSRSCCTSSVCLRSLRIASMTSSTRRWTRPSRSRARRRSKRREGFGAVERLQGIQDRHTGAKMLFVEECGQRLNNRGRRRVLFSTQFSQSTNRSVACHRGLAVRGEITQQGNGALVLQLGQAAKHPIANRLVPGRFVDCLLQRRQSAVTAGLAQRCGGLGLYKVTGVAASARPR